MRTLLLEQQLQSKDTFKNVTNNPASMEMKIREYENEANLMRNKLNTYNSNQMVINDLENMLK
jgi:hypothetical protein